jgi:hypothetical protein
VINKEEKMVGLERNFFVYLVKPEPKPNLSPNYLVNF